MCVECRADVARFAEKWANEGKVVIIAALDGTYQRRPFPAVLALLALSEAVDKLHAVCDGCGADASFTQRIGSESAVEVCCSLILLPYSDRWLRCTCVPIET